MVAGYMAESWLHINPTDSWLFSNITTFLVTLTRLPEIYTRDVFRE